MRGQPAPPCLELLWNVIFCTVPYIVTDIVLEQYGVYVEQGEYIVPNYLGKCSAPCPVLAVDPDVLIPSRVATLALALLPLLPCSCYCALALAFLLSTPPARPGLGLPGQSPLSLQGPSEMVHVTFRPVLTPGPVIPRPSSTMVPAWRDTPHGLYQNLVSCGRPGNLGASSVILARSNTCPSSQACSRACPSQTFRLPHAENFKTWLLCRTSPNESFPHAFGTYTYPVLQYTQPKHRVDKSACTQDVSRSAHVRIWTRGRRHR